MMTSLMTEQDQVLRNEALQAALRLPGANDADCVLREAQRIYEWLTGKQDA